MHSRSGIARLAVALAVAALTVAGSGCSDDDERPAATATPTTTATPAPSPSATPNCAVSVMGRVSDADAAPARGIHGAIVSAHLTVPRSYEATTDDDGHYALLVPEPYGCFIESLEVSAQGYVSQSLSVTLADLQAHPTRDFALVPSAPPASPTPTATASARPSATGTVAPSPTPSATASPQPTPTPTPCEVTVVGQVYEADTTPTQGIAGARIVARLNFPRSFDATTDESGHYSLFLPEMYGCYVERLEVSADGYVSQSLPVSIAELRNEPTRNFALLRSSPPK